MAVKSPALQVMEPGAIPAQVALASAVASLSPPLEMGVKWSNGVRVCVCVCVHACVRVSVVCEWVRVWGGGRYVSDYMIGHLPHLMSIFRNRTSSNGNEGSGCAIAVCLTGSVHWS